MKYEWILFDLDNTLLDFTGAARRAFSAALAQADIREQPHHFPHYQKANHHVWTAFENGTMDTQTLKWKRFEMLLAATGLEADPHILSRLFLENLVHNTTLLPGAMDLLRRLKGHTNLVIITNGLQDVQRPRIAHTGIQDFFSEIVVSDEIGMAKPDPAFFDFTLRQIGMPGKNTVLVVGDNPSSDIKGGMASDLDTCWYNPNNNPLPDGITPTTTAKNHDEIFDIIAGK